ncbi:MAG TPA: alanine racemase, partial [candidate division Zixibacteria bacterium]|nr:alanine racemase [candidate division Zixibacteria bacterium]
MTAPKLLSWIELSQSALRRNIESLRRLAGARMVAPSVKSNAYGHGLTEIITMLRRSGGCEYVTVHSLEEALTCRRAGWTEGIMVLGPLPPGEYGQVIEQDLEPAVFDLVTLRELGKLGDRKGAAIRTHLKLETGTNRQGFAAQDLPAVAGLYKRFRSLGRPHGASMHFANIEDTTVHEYAEQQLRAYRDL